MGRGRQAGAAWEGLEVFFFLCLGAVSGCRAGQEAVLQPATWKDCSIWPGRNCRTSALAGCGQEGRNRFFDIHLVKVGRMSRQAGKPKLLDTPLKGIPIQAALHQKKQEGRKQWNHWPAD